MLFKASKDEVNHKASKDEVKHKASKDGVKPFLIEVRSLADVSLAVRKSQKIRFGSKWLSRFKILDENHKLC